MDRSRNGEGRELLLLGVEDGRTGEDVVVLVEERGDRRVGTRHCGSSSSVAMNDAGGTVTVRGSDGGGVVIDESKFELLIHILYP